MSIKLRLFPQFRCTWFRFVGGFLLGIGSFLLKLSDGRISWNEVMFQDELRIGMIKRRR